MFLLFFKGIHQVPAVLSISSSIIAQLCCLMYTLLLLYTSMHTQFNIFPIYINEQWHAPVSVCEELESITLLVIEHLHCDIYSLVISNDYSIVISAPKMIGSTRYSNHILFTYLPVYQTGILFPNFVSTFYLV